MPVTRVSRLDPWLPPLLLMAVIFALSAQPDLNSGFGVLDLAGRKVVHATEFGLLCFLWWRVLARLAPVPVSAPVLAASFAIAVAYAATDEWHQTFVHGRKGSPVDVAIDAAGAAIAVALIARRGNRRDAVARGRPMAGADPR